jgi:hypothetical protein
VLVRSTRRLRSRSGSNRVIARTARCGCDANS